MKISYRQSARDHLKNSMDFAEVGGVKHLRAACLELRMAIEAICYDLLQNYYGELGNSAMKNWQPRKVIDELVFVDPNAEHTSHIAVGIEQEYGKPSKDMKPLGADFRFSAKWANKAHNSLGSFLHEPTISQYGKGKQNLDEKMRKKIEEVTSVLSPLLSSSLYHVNIGNFVSFECECGSTIKRKKEFLEAKKELSCLNCGRFFHYEVSDDEWVMKLASITFECPALDCGERHTVERHLAIEGVEINCIKCSAKIVFRKHLMAEVQVTD